MKIEKLKKNHTKGYLLGVISVSALILLAVYAGSRAKYKTTESIPLVSGTINYEIGDFNTVAMYQASGSGEYTGIAKIPESGYEINEEKSYCKVNGEKDPNARLYTNSNGEHVIGNLQKNSKCYVWFDVKAMTIPEMVASHNPTAGPTEFTGIADTDEGLLSGIDDDGTTYYFRGNVTNNWVNFAGFYWRIIRINGDGSIRMIYNGTTTDQTGVGTQIGTKAYNLSDNDNAYVGFMYGTERSTTYEATHLNTNNSTILGTIADKTTLLGWYKTNIVDVGYSSKISTEAGFCNDRKISTVSRSGYGTRGYGANATAYAPVDRVLGTSVSSWLATQAPTFKCSQSSADLFTANASSKGNKKLQYPVGLITMDEVIYAGGFGGIYNKNYYLYTYQNYWTMSPSHQESYKKANVFFVYTNGNISNWQVSATAWGVRPVINLSSDIKLTGSGTTSDPYKVV